jgi:hypothetical protein
MGWTVCQVRRPDLALRSIRDMSAERRVDAGSPDLGAVDADDAVQPRWYARTRITVTLLALALVGGITLIAVLFWPTASVAPAPVSERPPPDQAMASWIDHNQTAWLVALAYFRSGGSEEFTQEWAMAHAFPKTLPSVRKSIAQECAQLRTEAKSVQGASPPPSAVAAPQLALGLDSVLIGTSLCHAWTKTSVEALLSQAQSAIERGMDETSNAVSIIRRLGVPSASGAGLGPPI